MPTKIRLQRFGRKSKPIFKIVVADSRAKRDGKFIDHLGQYNPNTNPATIDLNFDSALDWVMKGAQPTNTALALLKYKGVMMKKHLLGGVAKGAFSEEEAEKRFEDWLDEKSNKINAKSENLSKAAEEVKKARIAAEKEISDARAQEIAKANMVTTEESPVAEEAPSNEEAIPEVKAEEPTDAPSKEEAPVAEEKTPEVKAEETPAKEESTEEKGAEE